MLKRFHSILFYVSNLNATEEFYKKLGFQVERAEGVVRAKLGGDVKLAFIDENATPIKNESGKTPKGTGIYTYIEADNVDEYYKELQTKGIKSTEPRSWPWGKREFVVKDPDGYKLVFYSVIK